MSQHETGAERRAKLPLSTKAKLFAGGVAASAVGLALIVTHKLDSANEPGNKMEPGGIVHAGRNPRREPLIYNPAVKRIVRPAMIDSGRQIIAAFNGYPELAHKTIGNTAIMLSITGHSTGKRRDGSVEDDFTSIYMRTGRRPGSQAPDLGQVKTITVSRQTGSAIDGFQKQSFGLYARPGNLYIAIDNFNPFSGLGNAWTQELPGLNEDGQMDSLAAGGNAPAIARSVVNVAPDILTLAESDLASMAPLGR